MKLTFEQMLSERIPVIFDGAMGAELQKEALTADDFEGKLERLPAAMTAAEILEPHFSADTKTSKGRTTRLSAVKDRSCRSRKKTEALCLCRRR